jgi:hypothetical protein
MNAICANCGIEITWQPTVVDGQTYCCLGCSLGGPCSCDYSNLPKVGEFRAVVRRTSVILLATRSGRSETRHEAAASRAADDSGSGVDRRG